MSQILSIPRARFVPVLLGLVVLAATVALKVGGGSNAALSANKAVSSTMHATVRQNNDIFLTFDDGSSVGTQDRVAPTIPAGTYTIRVSDDTDEHNFHIVGPGVDQSTPVSGSGSPTWTVTFQAGGLYRFVCDTHVDFMFGAFQASAAGGGGGSSGGSTGGSGGGSTGGSTGGSGGGSTGGSGGGSTGGSGGGASSGGGAAAALAGTLAATVNPTGKLTLRFKGKAVSKLKSGRYRITVVDKTAARSFLVQASKQGAITISTVPFVGTRSVTVNLKPGKWSFFTSAGAKSKTTFTVS
jgi:hypothetical protein